jgi:signal transduction histidine kinase
MIENENFLTETGKFIFSKLRQVTDSMCSKIDALNMVIAMKSYVVNDKEKLCFSKTMESIKLNHSEEIVQTRTVIKEDFSRSSHINYDPVQFDSILNNLISNSLKFRQPNYRLVIRVSTKKIGEHTELTIKDNGLGFNEKLGKSKIFGLFKRMHTHVEGSGIGLYIVNSIVTSNGGYIKVSSEVNKGTVFKLYLK